MSRRNLLPLLFLLLATTAVGAAPNRITLGDGTELSYTELSADSEQLYLWLPLEFGNHEANLQLGRRLAQAGLHTWIPDLLAPYFLPIESASMDEVPGAAVAALIEAAQRQTHKPVVVVAAGRSAITALAGARAWLELQGRKADLDGLILLHPKLYVGTPRPGVEPEFMPVALANQVPVYLLAPTQSPSRWRLLQDAAALGRQGAQVFMELVPGVRNFYFLNPDADAAERAMTGQLPADLHQAAHLLGALPAPPPAALAPMASTTTRAAPQVRGIEPVAGSPLAPDLAFPDTRGRLHRLSDYRGQVVLLNFWASWCPPCVHEMPSMDRLQQAMRGRPFAILAVNMAEEEAVVRGFLQRDVKVEFPVLLDGKGIALKDWDVFVYPTTYIIDKQGRVRAAMYGAIDWDTETIRAQLGALMKE